MLEREIDMVKTSKTAKKVNASMYNTLLRPVITEKSMSASENGRVAFMVPLDASKKDIKDAVEAIFNVEVKAVNTIRQFGKTKIFRGQKSTRSDFKKAFVKLADGQNIDVTTGI